MSLFKRLSATITGSLDQAISQIENQDAVVDSIVREARQELAKAKVRLTRVEADASRMQREWAQLELAIRQWTLRAQKSGENDQAKALECLRQRKLSAQQQSELAERIAQHGVIRKRLAGDVKLAESRVSTMLNKQHMMRTRESAAKAMVGVNAIENTVADDLCETFERWEIKVTETELMSGIHNDSSCVDSLEQEFISIEEEEELKLQLSELLASNGVDTELKEKGNE